MSDDVDVVARDARGDRELPTLFPWNRRLRHLQGISIRNLNVDRPVARNRGKTIADDDVEYTTKSPTKLLAQGEARILQHSRSSSDLKSPSKTSERLPPKAVTSYEKDGEHKSRPGGKLRRRSTLHWTGATPRTRQQKLEDVAASHLADTWFSVHYAASSEPVYVSEVMTKSMNPNFQFFDLEASGPGVTRLEELTLKVWATKENAEAYYLLVDLEVNLRSLQFIGRSLENFHHPLPPNCILFHLSDGIYTSFTDLPVEAHGMSAASSAKFRHGSPESTSSYDALMQLANLDDCVQDALRTRRKIESQINALLAENRRKLDLLNEQTQQRELLAATDRARVSERRQLKQLSRRRDELNQSLLLRRQAVAKSEQAQANSENQKASIRSACEGLQVAIEADSEQARGQIRRICETLSVIFPIEPLKNKALQFSIRNIYLPNSAFDDTNRDEIAAALGFTSHLVHMLSLYLSMPLPYPIETNGSESFISDPVSVALAQRRFPLHPTNVSYKFEYGVFLLNKDIEILMNKVGLRVLDIRHTLPNLKYLLYVLTAGKGELPSRKAGGIKGLVGGRITPSMSRRGSNESAFSNDAYPRRPSSDSHERNGSVTVPSKTSEKVSAEDPFHISPRAKSMPYRNSLLRDTG